MQRFTKYAIAPVLTLLASAASAEEGGFYLKIFGGASNLDDTSVSGAFAGDASFGSGFSTGAAFGYDYGTGPWRTELEFAYRTSDADTFAGGVTGDFASTSLMLNGYYDFASTGALTPFIGAGIGTVTEIDWDITGGAAPGEYTDRGGLAFQLMAGADYAISERISLTGEVRYFDAGSQTLSSGGANIDADYATVEVLAGVVWKF